MSETHRQAHIDAQRILRQALTAVDPETAVKKALHAEGARVWAGDFGWQRSGNGRVILLGAGKAAGPMARASEAIVAELNPEGLLITKYGHSVPLRHAELIEAGHPLPDQNGLRGCEKLLALAASARAEDLVLGLISGGGSALMPAPVAGITLEAKLLATDLLLRAGADIHELNTLRKHLSRIKGGGLARAAHPASLLTLAISDVIGNQPDVIASGPTVPDPSSFADALAVVGRYQLEPAMPSSVLRHLRRGAADPTLETWKVSDRAQSTSYLIVAGIEQATEAARIAAAELGYRSEILTTTQTGDARAAAIRLAGEARRRQQALSADDPPLCLIVGGETTVTVTGSGVGGRNQELALAAAIELEGVSGITLLAAGTDGSDGPTDAAGAMIDGETLPRGRRLGLDACRYLQNNDSYHFFDRLDSLVKTGPTRTNVMDLTLVLIKPEHRPNRS